MLRQLGRDKNTHEKIRVESLVEKKETWTTGSQPSGVIACALFSVLWQSETAYPSYNLLICVGIIGRDSLNAESYAHDLHDNIDPQTPKSMPYTETCQLLR